MSTISKEKIKSLLLNNKNKPLTKIPKIKNQYNDMIINRNVRENAWNNRFIYNKIPNYDSFKDKNVLCNKKYNNFTNYKKIDNYLNSKSPNNYLLNQTNIDNSQNDSNNFLCFTNNTRIQAFSAKSKNFSFTTKNNLSPLSNLNINISYVDNNTQNLYNLKKLWDELEILKPYRNFFNYIYKELETEYKEEFYKKGIQELNKVKLNIKTLKYHIGLRQEIIEEIRNLNEKLGKELINKNNKAKEVLLNEISNKIIILREQTINVCQSMKNLKEKIFSINRLDKYDFDIISKKFKFDKNYVIKMKSELNFLKEGFAKYFFNIENDQTPFLLKASDKTKLTKEDYFIRIIPIDNELKNKIIDCIFYIHQELIAYQNINMNKKNLQRISPIKKKYNEFNNNIFNNKILKYNIEYNSPKSLGSLSDRDIEIKKNGIEEYNKNNKVIESYIGDIKIIKKDEKIKNNKQNGNSFFSNKQNNLKKKINENMNSINIDSYENIDNKKENYEKDQILDDNIIQTTEEKNKILKDKNQSSFINEEINNDDDSNKITIKKEFNSDENNK